jgi:hypothetical protein
VFRYPAIFLIATFLSIGPNYFQRVHQTEVDQALAKIATPRAVGNAPLKRVPVRPPVHDPASCPVCIALHAPIDGHLAPAPSLQPIDRIGSVAQYLPAAFTPIHVAAEQCRGPPAV